MTCSLCHDDAATLHYHRQRNHPEWLCDSCFAWSQYWDALTSSEVDDFFRAVAEYEDDRDAERELYRQQFNCDRMDI